VAVDNGPVEPEPNLHAHLFVPILAQSSPLSVEDLGAAVAAIPRKQVLANPWLRAAQEAGLVERASNDEERDHMSRQLGPRLFRLTPAGSEQVENILGLARADCEFLARLQELGAGQTADSLSADGKDSTGYVQLWMESAFARGLIGNAERNESLKAMITPLGEAALEDC
jgi:hypothetical protein